MRLDTRNFTTSRGCASCALLLALAGTACSRDDGRSLNIASTALENGKFDETTDPWWGPGVELADGQMCITVPAGDETTDPWATIVGQSDLQDLAAPWSYRFNLSASSSPASSFLALVAEPEDPWTQFSRIEPDATPDLAAFSQKFTMLPTEQPPAINFQLGANAPERTICFDNVSLDQVPLVENGGFVDALDPWWTSNVTSSDVSDDGACFEVPGGNANVWDVIVGQGNIPMASDAYYRFSFRAKGSQSVPIKALVGEPDDPYFEWATVYPTLGTEYANFSQVFQFTGSDQIPQVAFQIGGGDVPEGESWTLCLDDVFVEPVNLVQNGHFVANSDPWWGYESSGVMWDARELSDSGVCVDVPGGTSAFWDVIIGQNEVELEAGEYYDLAFSASANRDVTIRAVVGEPADPYTPFLDFNPALTSETQVFRASFPMGDSEQIPQIAFQIGGQDEPWTFCLDDVWIIGGGAPSVYEADTGPRVRVNQVAYLPYGPKGATIVTEALDPLTWDVVDSDGVSLLSGESTPFGLDESSQLNVHRVDFSSLTTIGDGYALVADGETSHPFSIGTESYEQLRLDSLDLYYTQRSGEEIDGALAGEAYARPAGHSVAPGDGEINQGDLGVPCQPADDSLAIYGEPWTCDYTLDVVGGWYDAGDHGKYVVNGGISVYQLLNAFERTKTAPSTDLGALSDATLSIPEAGNGVPDVLDEARHELEFFLSMMVPEGEPLAGMAHHKVHDNVWTGLPLLPHKDPNARWLHRPSTAATLNLAATAAQGARIFAPYDAQFAKTLLKAAHRAWNAALSNPVLYAPAADGNSGGGPYDDGDVTDEFYWAAAELYLTTGKQKYLDAVLASPHHTADVFPAGGFSWGSVAALGRMALATTPSSLPDRDAVIASVVAGAQRYVDAQTVNGFMQPYAPDDGVYVWGSNSQILNNLVVIATAYDLTADETFRSAALSGFDYILGRNALNNSYVTDYGSAFSKNMHSRWYANQLDPSLPNPPSGTVSGGPNSMTETWDPTVSRLLAQGCAPQFCYVDDINSWSTNELTINWNAPLAWLSSFIADQDSAESDPFGSCAVKVHTLGEHLSDAASKLAKRSRRFLYYVDVTNLGKKKLKNWELNWSFTGDQRVQVVTGGNATQDGAQVTVAGSRKLKPNRPRRLVVIGDRGDLASPTPETFFLNGEACSVR